MRNLLDFLLRYSSAFLFAFLLVISLVMLFSSGRFHSSVWFTSANMISTKIYGINNEITGYFNLKQINQSLQQSNAQLENEILNLREELAAYKSMVKDTIDYSDTKRFDYILATVLNNSTRHPHNYFTVNKGESDGVKNGMGVVDQNGVVGIVNVTGPSTSRIMSVLNSTQHISVRLKGTNLIGSLTWRCMDPEYAYMEEVPRHSTFTKGDTVVTSGYSTSFPAGIPVGYVIGKINSDNDSFYVLKVRLASDFHTISNVRILKDDFKQELDSLATFDIEE